MFGDKVKPTYKMTIDKGPVPTWTEHIRIGVRAVMRFLDIVQEVIRHPGQLSAAVGHTAVDSAVEYQEVPFSATEATDTIKHHDSI